MKNVLEKKKSGIITPIDYKNSLGVKLIYWGMFAFLCLMVVICLLPVLFAFFSGFKTIDEFYAIDVKLFPEHINWSKMVDIIKEMHLLRGFKNSLIMFAINWFGDVIVGGIAGYTLSRLKPRGSRTLFKLMLWTMMMPGTLSMELLIYEKGRATDRCGKVLFADLSKFKAFNNDTILSLSEIYKKYDSENKFTRIVRSEEIKGKEYVLYPQIYLEDESVSGGQLRLGDVASVIRGLQEFSSYNTSSFEERYFLNVRDIQDGEIIYDTAEKIEIGNLQWEKKFRIREDDIIITSRGASLKIAIVPPNPLPAYISGNLMIIRTDSKKYSPYILYEYLMSEKGQHILSLVQTGTTIRILGTKKTEQIAIPGYDAFEHSVIGGMLKVLRLKYRTKLQEINNEYKANRKEIILKLGIEEENTNE